MSKRSRGASSTSHACMIAFAVGLAIAGLAPTLTGCASAQATPGEPPSSGQGQPSRNQREDNNDKPKPYNEVVTAEAVTDSGLYILHRVDEKLLQDLAGRPGFICRTRSSASTRS